MLENVSDVWSRCLLQLEEVLRKKGKSREFSIYFTPIEPVKLENSCLTVRVPSPFYYEFLEENYLDELTQVLRKEIGPRANLKYEVIMPQSPLKSPVEFTFDSAQGVGMVQPQPSGEPSMLKIESNLQPDLNFDNFVEGPNNQTVVDAARVFATFRREDQQSYHTLVLYGGTGLGKTHLLHAIGLEVKRTLPTLSVMYVSATDFLSQFQQATKQKLIPAFVSFYQQVDLLLLDDVHLLSGMDGTQQIFINIYEKLRGRDGRIALSLNCEPRNLTGFRREVQSRICWGLMFQMIMPTYETRLEILRRKVRRDGYHGFPEEVFEYIARNVTFSVRELEGVLTSMLARSLLGEKETLSLDMARQLVDSIVQRDRNEELTVERILDTVCSHYHFDREQVCGKSRKREVVEARQMVCFLAKQLTSATYEQIGRVVGGKTHATVIYSCRAIENLMSTEERLRTDYRTLNEMLS